MTLPSLSISKNWFTATTVREANWDNIRTPLLDWGAKVNLAFNQIVVDAFGSTYTIDNDGIPNLATSLQDQINAIIAGSATISSLTLIDNSTAGATLNQFTARWRSPSPATNDTLIFRQSFDSNTTQDAIQSQIQFQITDVTHATRGSAISWFTMNNGTLAETLRLGPTGALGLISGQRLFLDGVSLGGDTYIFEGAANELRLVAGGNSNLQVSAAFVGVLSTADFFVTSTKKVFLDGGGDTSIRESAANTMTFEAGGADLIGLSSAGLNLITTLPLFIPTSAPTANRSLALVGGILQAHDGTSAKSYLRTDTFNFSSHTVAGINLGTTNDVGWVDVANGTLTFTVNVAGVYLSIFSFTLNVLSLVAPPIDTETYFRLFDGSTASVVKVMKYDNAVDTLPQISWSVTISHPFTLTAGSQTIKLQKWNTGSTGVSVREIFVGVNGGGLAKMAYRVSDS